VVPDRKYRLIYVLAFLANVDARRKSCHDMFGMMMAFQPRINTIPLKTIGRATKPTNIDQIS